METKFAIGLVLILLVCLFWSGASVLVQYIYCTLKFDEPIFVTFVGSALTSLFVPLHLILERLPRLLWKRGECKKRDGGVEQRRRHVVPWSSGPRPSQKLEVEGGKKSVKGQQNKVDGVKKESRQFGSKAGGMSGTTIDGDGAATNDLRDGIKPAAGSATGKKVDDDDVADRSSSTTTFFYGHVETMRLAATLCPLQLVSVVFHDLSLSWTSVASMMVLSSTSTVFAFAFGVYVGDERFTFTKAVGVVATVLGTIVTAWNDAGGEEHVCDGGGAAAAVISDPLDSAEDAGTFMTWGLMGDIAGLISAMGYGAYTTALHVKCPEDGSISMELLFGYIGLLNALFLAPGILGGWQAEYLDLSNLTWTVLGYLVLAGFLNDVAAEYLWAQSVVLTSATIANVGLSLTVPIAFLWEWFYVVGSGDDTSLPDIASAFGAFGILVGFVLVSMPSTANLEGGVVTSKKKQE